jgi:S-adenosylmethionine synthetase
LEILFDRCNHSNIILGLKRHIPPIIHYSSEEPYTKYEICLVFAKILGLPHRHIIPDENPPTGEGATTRPRDCHLYTKETENLGVEGGLGLSLFEEWWTERLSGVPLADIDCTGFFRSPIV